MFINVANTQMKAGWSPPVLESNYIFSGHPVTSFGEPAMKAIQGNNPARHFSW